jgi:hypothetical protein
MATAAHRARDRAGIAERPPGAWERRPPAKPANENEVTTGFGVESTCLEVGNPKRIPSASACEPFREAIELGLSRGRDATAIWQELVAENGFDGGYQYQTVKRYVRKLRGNQPLQPSGVILMGPGEKSQVPKWTTVRALLSCT